MEIPNWKKKFLKALKEDEVFATEVRALLLSTDLLALPHKMTKMEDRMTKMEDRMAKMEDRMTKMEDRMTKMEDRMTKMEDRMTKIEKDVEILKTDVAILKGSDRERWYRDRGHAIFGRLFEKGKPYDAQVARILWQAVKKGVISDEERNDALDADLFWYGEIENRWVVLVGEVSYTINNNDVQRAKERAAILRKAGIPAIPLVGGVKIETGLELDEITCIVDGKISRQEFEKLFEKISIRIKK